MTREQYDARAAALLRDYARVYNTHNPEGHMTTAERSCLDEISGFVRQFWRDEFYPPGKY